MSSNVNMSKNTSSKVKNGRPYVKIIEQPSSKGLRFRYECEKKFAAAILGVHSKEDKRTFPTIKILNCKGPAFIVLSCVTKDPPYRPHPHNLIGKIQEISNGICHFKFEQTEMALGFDNLSIQCVKKKDVEKSLALRKKLQVDPFKTGFDHASDSSNLDLHSLRLCFQVFLEGSKPGVFNVPLQPVVTDPIYDRRSKSEPEIVFLSHLEASVAGGTEMCILCERADKEDINVVFYQEENNWEEIAQFTPPSVYKRVAIAIKIPPYVDQDITEPAEVKLLLRRRSNGDVSDSFPFKYLPLESYEQNPLKRKRAEDMCLYERLQEELTKNNDMIYIPKSSDFDNSWELPALQSENNVEHRELINVTELSVNMNEYCDSLGSNTNTSNSKEKYCLNKLQAENDDKRQPNFTQVSNLEPLPPIDSEEKSNDEPKHSNTLDTDDWIQELLQTIEEDLEKNNKEPEIVKEPEIKYISPNPIPNVKNSSPEIQNGNNVIVNNILNNNHEEVSLHGISNFYEEISPILENLVTNMSTLENISELQDTVIPNDYLIDGQHPQYAVNINENQWSHPLDHVSNSQQSTHYSQMSVDNNFNGHSYDNYMMNTESIQTNMQSLNQENTWGQVHKTTLSEFDPLYSSQNWHTSQEYNNYTQ